MRLPTAEPDDAPAAETDWLRCSECRREPRADERPEDEWRVYSDGVGELHVFCLDCAEREFASDTRVPVRLIEER